MTSIDTTSQTASAYDTSTVQTAGGASGDDSTMADIPSSSAVVVDDGVKDALRGRSESSVVGVVTMLSSIVESVVTLVSTLITWLADKKDAQRSTSSGAGVETRTPTKVVEPTSSNSRQGAGAVVSSKSAQRPLQAIRDDKGAITVRTADGYVVKAEGRDQAWRIIAPDGRATRIWGDPHVKESDGDRWDFTQRSTFVFGQNKVTVETVPAKGGRTYTGRITVYSGDERITIGGIERDLPTILAMSSDGKQHDDSLSDGAVFSRGATARGESWSTIVGGKKKVMK